MCITLRSIVSTLEMPNAILDSAWNPQPYLCLQHFARYDLVFQAKPRQDHLRLAGRPTLWILIINYLEKGRDKLKRYEGMSGTFQQKNCL